MPLVVDGKTVDNVAGPVDESAVSRIDEPALFGDERAVEDTTIFVIGGGSKVVEEGAVVAVVVVVVVVVKSLSGRRMPRWSG
jgi:hypothetical protein